MEDDTLRALKDLAAHNLIPNALVVGTFGNLINFVILSRCRLHSWFIYVFVTINSFSRPCIRSSTNIFLMMLSLADLFFMLAIHVFSRQYHDDVHKFDVYWRMFGLSNWFYSALCKGTFANYVRFFLGVEGRDLMGSYENRGVELKKSYVICERSLITILPSITFLPQSQCTLQFIWLWAWLWIDTLLCAAPLGRNAALLERRMSFQVSRFVSYLCWVVWGPTHGRIWFPSCYQHPAREYCLLLNF